MGFFNRKNKIDTEPDLDEFLLEQDYLDNLSVINDFGYDSETKALLDLEEFVIGIYTNQMSLITLLLSKNIITEKEFLEAKDRMKATNEDIKNLYTELENKKNIMEGSVQL